MRCMAIVARQTPHKPLHVVILLGTIREGRMSELAADFITARLIKRPLVTNERVDPRQFDFNFGEIDYGTALKERFAFYTEAVVRADGIIVVTPEYNHGYPGSLKMVLDTLYPEYRHKAAAVVGVSSGPWGGVRVIENLTPVLKELGLVVSQLGLNIERVEKAFDARGEAVNQVLGARAEKFIDEFLWLAETLRWGRANLI